MLGLPIADCRLPTFRLPIFDCRLPIGPSMRRVWSESRTPIDLSWLQIFLAGKSGDRRSAIEQSLSSQPAALTTLQRQLFHRCAAVLHDLSAQRSTLNASHALHAAISPLQNRVRSTSLTARDTLSFPLFGIGHWKRISRYVAQDEK